MEFSPGRVVQLVGAPSHTPKCYGFDTWSCQCLSVCLSVSLSLFLSLSPSLPRPICLSLKWINIFTDDDRKNGIQNHLVEEFGKIWNFLFLHEQSFEIISRICTKELRRIVILRISIIYISERYNSNRLNIKPPLKLHFYIIEPNIRYLISGNQHHLWQNFLN